MAHFFFHLATANERHVDEEGVEFLDANAAFLDAYQAALDICIDMLRKHCDPGHYRFEICDQDGKLVFELPFREVMRPKADLRHPAAVLTGSNVAFILRQQVARSQTLNTELSAQFVEAFGHVREARAKLGLSRRA